MKLVNWVCDSFAVPMMEDDEGNLWATTKGVASALGVTERDIRKIAQSNPEDFDELLSTTTGSAKEFLLKNKAEFGIIRLRGDMKIWSEDEVLMFAMVSRTPRGRVARREFLKFIKANMRKHFVDFETFRALMERVELMEEAKPAMSKAASAAGAALAAHRGTTKLRMPN